MMSRNAIAPRRALLKAKKMDRGEIIDPVWSGEDAGRILKERGLKWDNVEVGDQGGLLFELGGKGVAYWDRTHRTMRILKKEGAMISEKAKSIRRRLVTAGIPRGGGVSKKEDILKAKTGGLYASLYRKYTGGSYEDLLGSIRYDWEEVVTGHMPIDSVLDLTTDFKGAKELEMDSSELDGAIKNMGQSLGKPPAQLFIATDGVHEVAVDTQGYDYWRYQGIIIPQATELINMMHQMLHDDEDVMFLAIEDDGNVLVGYNAQGKKISEEDILGDYSFKG